TNCENQSGSGSLRSATWARVSSSVAKLVISATGTWAPSSCPTRAVSPGFHWRKLRPSRAAAAPFTTPPNRVAIPPPRPTWATPRRRPPGEDAWAAPPGADPPHANAPRLVPGRRPLFGRRCRVVVGRRLDLPGNDVGCGAEPPRGDASAWALKPPLVEAEASE